METQQHAPETTVPPVAAPETIFSDMVDTTPYEKSLKTARIWLYVVTALQLGVGIYEYSTIDEPQVALFAGMIDGGIGILFLLLALWSYKSPVYAFATALIAYVVIHVGLMIMEPANIYQGIIIKVLVTIALVKAFKDAREVEKLRESVGG